MTEGPIPDPFLQQSSSALEPPRPIVPTPATMSGKLRGRRILIGVPGHGWRGDLRADEKVVQGSRTYVPVISEAEWYRAEMEQAEVFAPLVPVDRVWVEEFGIAGIDIDLKVGTYRLVSLDEPPRRTPTAAIDADSLTGRRVVDTSSTTGEIRDLRALTELYTSDDGGVCVLVSTEMEWYRWSWSGKTPRALEVAAHTLWVE